MYGQGSYNSQFGRGPPPPRQPPYRHQLPGLPPLPPHFQQGSLAPAHVFQRGPPAYQHGPPVSHAALRQTPPDAAANGSQPYFHPQPSVHGSTPLPRMCSTDQQNVQLPSHLGTQNVHHMPPHPPRVLPPLPPATMFRAPVQLQSQQPGDTKNLRHMPSPPPPPPLPPPTSSSFTSNPFGSFEHSTGRNSHMPSVAPLPPPPPPFDPPPIPSSPPPLTSPLPSSVHHEAASNLTSSSKPYCSEVSTGFVDKDVTTYEVRHNVSQNDGCLKQEVPPPPPKPAEENVIQKIEDFCQLIAKNGPGYEDFVRQNESGNPDFEFLFAGDPGSESAIAHQYFLWLKKKSLLACKLKESRSELPLGPLGTCSSMQSNHLEVAPRTYSPADSDMEMEDDISQSGNDTGVNHSIEGKTSGYDLIHSEVDVKELSHKQRMSESEKATCTSPVLLEQADKVVSNVCSPVISSADECHLTSNLTNSGSTSVDDKFPLGAPAAAQDLYSDKKYSQLTKGGSGSGSPFRLVQDYASDDISENDDELHPEYVSPLKDSSSVAVGASNPHRNTGLCISPEIFDEDSVKEAKETVMASITSGTSDEHVHHKHINQAYISHAETPQVFQKKDSLEDASVEVCINGNFHNENAEKGAKSASNSPKVDEFGRLVREGASESESDDSHYNGRRGKRGRSQSRSPLDRRRRRSPWRRREKRSRSRSWSPRKRRSRSRSPRNRRSRSRSPRRRRHSKSPASRHVGEFSGDVMGRDKGQIPGCFDFRRGRCYRGASCRYMHHDSEKGDVSKLHRSKQHLEVPSIPKDFNTRGEITHNLKKESDQQHHLVKIAEMQQGQDIPVSSFVARKDIHYEKREESVKNAKQSGSFLQDSRLIDSHTVKSDTFKPHGGASPGILPLENPATVPSQSKLSDPLLQNADCPPQQTDKSSISDFSLDQASRTSVNKLPVSEPLPNTVDFRHHSTQLPPPPPAFSQGVTTQHMTHSLGNYNLTSQSASFASQSVSGERFPSYMLPGQQSNLFIPPIPSWTPLPPPLPGASSQIRPHVAVLPTSSQVGDFQQQAFPPMQEPNRSISHAEDLRLKPLPPYNLQSQQFIGHGLLREDQSTHLPTLGPGTSRSFPQSDNQHVPAPFLRELSASKMQPSPFCDNLPPGELLKSTSQIPPHLHQQQPPYDSHPYASVGSSSKFPPDLQEVNQSSHPPDFRGSSNSTYSNPHASTFEQPLSSKFSSDAFRKEGTTYSSKYASPFSMSYAQVDMRNTGTGGSRQANSSPNSARVVGQNFPRSGGDQYDPLLDSFDPSSYLPKKPKNVQTREPSSDSDIMLRHSGSNKPLDAEENNKKKDIGGVAVGTAVYNEEYGESVDVEVGAVENESPSYPTGAANMNAGEIEIDQIKSPSKSKNKESRSMKLFKVALADFVKEVLKPSWRQGNMSKEAFKTIVKKTVDKVSGAMNSHQIPKSRAKIDQYIVSSQRKLTKLVMGYVDKYVKM